LCSEEYLKDILRYYACHRECDYCGTETDEDSSAPVAEIMEPIGNAVFKWFNNPEDAGEFWDSEDDCYFSGDEAIDTTEMVKSLLDCNEQLFKDIAEAFVNNEWVETANGHWLGSHPHELMTFAWERFADIVKHESRYFFQQTLSSFSNQEDEYESAQQENYNPANFLPTLGELVNKLKLFDTLPTGKTLFRARPKEEGKPFPLNAKELGAPPSKYSRAGRMNPAGISYLYLAFEQETALAEVRSLQTSIGQVEAQRELQVLDLTNLPEKPSIFDDQHYDELVGLFFIDEFINEITKPIVRDGSEHIEYVPSQVVSEYFALMFHLEDGKRLDGIKYPSSVRPGHHNLVLFPTERSFEPVFDQVEFQDGWDWQHAPPDRFTSLCSGFRQSLPE
jgi:RES domain-containing protein